MSRKRTRPFRIEYRGHGRIFPPSATAEDVEEWKQTIRDEIAFGTAWHKVPQALRDDFRCNERDIMSNERKIQFVGELPAGCYFIGDPSYLFPPDVWTAVLTAYERAAKHEAAVFEYNGHACFISPTNSGDGGYCDQASKRYGVDSGLIGAIPLQLVTPHSGVALFDEPSKIGADPGHSEQGKRIQIGDIVIKT